MAKKRKPIVKAHPYLFLDIKPSPANPFCRHKVGNFDSARLSELARNITL